MLKRTGPSPKFPMLTSLVLAVRRVATSSSFTEPAACRANTRPSNKLNSAHEGYSFLICCTKGVAHFPLGAPLFNIPVRAYRSCPHHPPKSTRPSLSSAQSHLRASRQVCVTDPVRRDEVPRPADQKATRVSNGRTMTAHATSAETEIGTEIIMVAATTRATIETTVIEGGMGEMTSVAGTEALSEKIAMDTEREIAAATASISLTRNTKIKRERRSLSLRQP